MDMFGQGRVFAAQIVTNNGVILYNENIRSITINEAICNDSNITIGNIISTTATIKLISINDEDFDKINQNRGSTTIQINMVVGNTDGRDEVTYKLGTYYCTDFKREDNLFTLECTDRTAIFYDSKYKSNLDFPAAVENIVMEIVGSGADSSVNVTDLLGHEIDEPVGYTRRNLLGYIAGTSGMNIRRNKSTNCLEFVRYQNVAPVAVITADEYYSLSDGEIASQINSIVIKGDEETYTYGDGSDIEYTEAELYHENPLVTYNIADDINDICYGYRYMPFECSFCGNLDISAGDVVEVVRRDGTSFRTVVMENEIYFDGGLSQTISAYGNTSKHTDVTGSTPTRISESEKKTVTAAKKTAEATAQTAAKQAVATAVNSAETANNTAAWYPYMALDYLETNYNALTKATGSRYYFKIKDNELSCVEAVLDTSNKVDYKTADGQTVYYTDAAHKYFTLTSPAVLQAEKYNALESDEEKAAFVEQFKVKVYATNEEYEKLKIAFTDVTNKDGSKTQAPVVTFGIGDGSGGGIARIFKDTDGLIIELTGGNGLYIKQDGIYHTRGSIVQKIPMFFIADSLEGIENAEENDIALITGG